VLPKIGMFFLQKKEQTQVSVYQWLILVSGTFLFPRALLRKKTAQQGVLLCGVQRNKQIQLT
jgi:hypothetical protein